MSNKYYLLTCLFGLHTLNNVLLHLSIHLCLCVCSSVPLTQEPVLQHRQHPAKQSERSRNGKCHTDSCNAGSIAP